MINMLSPQLDKCGDNNLIDLAPGPPSRQQAIHEASK